MTWQTVLPVVTLLLGAGASFAAESVRHRTARREALADSLRAERTKAYLALLDAAHTAAHTLGRSAVDCPNPLPPDADRFWLVDSDVTRHLRTLEMVGGDAVIAEARELRRALLTFREAVAAGARYESDEYRAAYAPVTHARDRLVGAARDELLRAR